MARFRIQDMRSIEKSPTSAGSLKNKLGAMLYSSVSASATVERIDPKTGAYRIILQGTIDPEESGFDDP
jgi:hypothetical protein